MKKLVVLLFAIFLTGCVSKPQSSSQIFTNAQVQYQSKESNALARKRDLAMPSYFVDIEYGAQQIELNKSQEMRIAGIFKKLLYSDEYRLYVSFGIGQDSNASSGLTQVVKRAEFVKKMYHSKLKDIQVAFIKNQKPNTAFFRLIA